MAWWDGFLCWVVAPPRELFCVVGETLKPEPLPAFMSSEHILELDQVTKLYGTVIGVNDFSMQLKPGAYGLLGPNGAGKSTLLSLLIGQLVPTRGTVTVMGESPRNNPALMRKIGFCPGFEGLYAKTTGFDWVTLLLRLHGVKLSLIHI